METKSRKSEHSGQLHVVLGVNGNSGQYVTEELVKRGYTVRGISRSGTGPQGVETMKADALNSNELEKALRGASVIYHCLGIPYSQWVDNHPQIMKNIIDAASVNGNGELIKVVFADNLYAIGEEGAKRGKMNEETPLLAKEKKGLLRKKLVEMLFDADRQGKIIAVVGKGSDFFGPKATNSMFEFFLRSKILNNKPAAIFGNENALHSYIYVKDFARSLVTLGLNDKANGKVWILPHYEARSIKEFIESFYEEVGVNIPVKVKTNPEFFLKLVGLFNKEIREFSKVLYQMKNDWVVDDSKFRSTFRDFESTPLSQAFKETFEWYQEKTIA